MNHTDADNVKPTEECHKVHNVDESDILVGKLFSSHDQAWYFYKEFAREHGLSARRGTTRLDMEENVKTQEFCCSKEGYRVSKVNTVDRQCAHMPITRTRCKARIVVTTTNTNDQCVISKSYQKHNHALCTPAMTPFMRSNRAVSKADTDEATSLKEVGVGTSQVMNYLTQQAGGYHNVGFTHKDLYNALQRGKPKQIVDGDVNALIAYFDYKKHDDPGFFVAYSVDKSEALHNLIWSDSTLRSDYICFGDLIAFDTTYKDNLYGRPIMPIVGVNYHHNIIVFATAIIADETSQSFEWVLQNFLEAMMNKSPISIVTDGDREMQRVIKFVIPNAKHILCSWHLSRNAQANIDGISRMRLNELKADYLSSQTKPFQIIKLVEFESHASEIYTRESVHAFQEELQRETLKFETVGLPCHHQLHVLKHLDYTYLLGSLIQSRWTKDAKASAPSFVDLNVPPEIMQMARFASLCATTSMLCYAASKTDASFKTARDEMKRLIEEFENSFGMNDSVNRSNVLNNVRDPQ
ncbi:hypothetical protein F3Y22_tig00110785pilonHSYRG00180 [Hibiscus syriacus]|uniref:Uncharacterized protein n=1 Tax=Hibiscus syriacus TaxID=106335 RepID=A0A6A2ZSZ7_HIBSY|nr:hypothetical protein F3Y22_tig00110785pilonHSYRG00180 [Hibiscus syriacus]